jgi:hypothetical protein
MELLVILLAVGLLDVAALRWGVDSRDGRDWRRPSLPGQPWWETFWDRRERRDRSLDQRTSWRA